MLDTIGAQRGGNQSVSELLGYLELGESTLGSGGRIICVDGIWGRQYLGADLNQGQQLLIQLQDRLSQEAVEPTVKVISDVKALSAFAYTGENQLVVHLVNYRYDLENDLTSPIPGLELEISLDELQADGLTVTYYSPDSPQGQVLQPTVEQDTLRLTSGAWS